MNSDLEKVRKDPPEVSANQIEYKQTLKMRNCIILYYRQ